MKTSKLRVRKARVDRFAADRRKRKVERRRHAEKADAKRDEFRDILSKYKSLRTERLRADLRRIAGGLPRENQPCFDDLVTAFTGGRSLDKSGDRLDAELLTVLANVSLFPTSWTRKPADWRGGGYNAGRRLASLLRHVLARYPVPVWFDSVWTEPAVLAGTTRLRRRSVPARRMRWWIAVAQGSNLRNCDDLPFAITKKQAHFIMRAPCEDWADVCTSFRWGQAMAEGAGKSLAEALARSRMGRGFSTPDREAFYAEYIRWLVAEPKDGFFDVDRVDPVLDYLLTQKFGMAEDVHDGGDGMEAEQPNLSLKGRRLVRVLALTDAWHDELRGPIDQVDRKTLKLRWNPAPVPGLRIVEGDGENRKLVTITQLVTAADLIAEGRAMHHCVASYISTCQSGRSAIFSMRIASGFDELKRALTIEVAPGTREIWQARGRFNELPTKAEDRFLSRWAANIGVKIRGK